MSSRSQTFLIIFLSVCAVALSMLQTADQVGQSHLDEAFKRALLAFAIARGLNGAISVAQGTEIAIQPAGVGINFAPGQILDPINDLVERFSWIMLLASSSLGVQKILLSMSAWQGLLIAVLGTAVLFIAAHFLKPLAPWRSLIQRLFLFVLVLRFMMPAISVANDWVYSTFLEADYLQASERLDEARVVIGELNEQVIPAQADAPTGVIDRARRAYRQAVDSVDIDKRLDEYRAAAETISENTIRLVVVFLMQSLVFPLMFLFIMYAITRKIARGLLTSPIPLGKP